MPPSTVASIVVNAYVVAGRSRTSIRNQITSSASDASPESAKNDQHERRGRRRWAGGTTVPVLAVGAGRNGLDRLARPALRRTGAATSDEGRDRDDGVERGGDEEGAPDADVPIR